MDRKVATYCRNDGHPFTGFVFQFPVSEDLITKKWIFDKRIFCSGSCMKCYLRMDVSISQTLIANAELYLLRDLNIMDCPTAPDPALIAVFNINGKGFTIEEYRDFNKSQFFIEKPDYYPINKNVFIAEQQINNPIPFEQLIRENHGLDSGGPDSLYKRKKDEEQKQELELEVEEDLEELPDYDDVAIEEDDDL